MITPRERMLTTLSHQRPDRIPTTMHARNEVQRALVEHLGLCSFDEVMKHLGADLYADVELSIETPRFTQADKRTLEGDCPYAGRRFIFHDERTFEDVWGVVRRVGSDGKYVEWISGPLKDSDDPSRYEFPSAADIGGEQQLRREVQEAKQSGMFVRSFIPNPYKVGWYLRGMENLLADYVGNPGYVRALYDRICLFYTQMLEAYTRAGVDMVGIEGDIAMQDRIIMGPQRWRAIDKPRLAAMIRACKRINPDVYVFFHSDGDLTELMPDLIEIGFDVIDSMQPECMDILAIKREFGDRCTLHGCGSLQKVLPFGTPEECKAEVIGLIEQCGYNGGLVLRPSNMIGFDVPLENIIAWFETARDYKLS